MSTAIAFILLSMPTTPVVTSDTTIQMQQQVVTTFEYQADDETAANRAQTNCNRFVNAARMANLVGVCAQVNDE